MGARVPTPVAAALAGALLLACAPQPRSHDPGVLVITEAEQTASFIRNFNPFFEWGDVRWPARRSMYEPLMMFEVLRGGFVPWLATGYAWSADLRALSFDLRRGVLWSDGRPFTAADVAFTFDLMRRHAALDPRGVWRYIAAIETPDDHRVVFRLAEPYVPLLEYVAQQPVVPRHVWEGIADPVSFMNPSPIATGPFTEVISFRTQSYEIGRNPRYWQPGKPKMRAIRFLAFPSNEQENLALVSGELDWAGSFVPAIDRTFVARDPAHHAYWFPPLEGMVFLYANTRRAPLGDVRVRKALSQAIDRATVVQVAMHGYTAPGSPTGLSDAYARWRSPAAERAGAAWVRFDPAASGRLLDAAGLPRRGDDGERFALSIIVPAGFSDWVRAAQVIARGLRAVGVDARVDALDFNAWFEKLEVGDFDVSLGWSEVHPSTHAVFRALMGTETLRPLGEPAAENWHRFALPAADALLAELERTVDPQAERRLSERLQLLFVEHAPAIPLFPGPLWGECNTSRAVGFPSAQDPYTTLSPNWQQSLMVLTELRPR